jgi:hypothetical protein
MDPILKMEYHQKAIKNNLSSIEDLIVSLYEKNISDFIDGDGVHLFSHKDLIDTINNVTQLKDSSKFTDCILIHEKENQNTLCFKEQAKYPAWKKINNNDNSGKAIVEIIKKQMWNNYEIYLIRKIENNDMDYENISRHLNLYYKFISCFDLIPKVYDVNNDSELLFNIDEKQYSDFSGSGRKRKYERIYDDCKKHLDDMGRDAICMFVDYIVENNGSYSYDAFNDKIKTIFVRDPKYMREMAMMVK